MILRLVMKTVPQITALQAHSLVNYFLSVRLPDRLTADLARLSTLGDVWQVCVLLTYPGVGAIGQVGIVLVSITSKKIVSYTPLEEMKQTGEKLLAEHLDKIQASFSFCPKSNNKYPFERI